MNNDMYIKVCPSIQNITTASLIKTGQTISYSVGDDGDLEAGREVDFMHTFENNPFGNNNRFTDIDGAQIYSVPVAIDWSTFDGIKVLGYQIGTNPLRNFSDSVSAMNSLEIGSYLTGWRLTNKNELMNIMNHGVNFPLGYPPFNDNSSANYWTSTTVFSSSGQGYMIQNSNGSVQNFIKSNPLQHKGVRDFTLNGNILV